MDPTEFGKALIREYSVKTHAVDILDTCYGGRANWNSIVWTPPHDTAIGGATDDGQASSEVLGISLFWVLLALTLSCVFHPLATSIHNASRFRRYLHISPLFCFADAIYLILQCLRVRRLHPMSWARAIQAVVAYRLRDILPHISQPSGHVADDALPGARDAQNTLAPSYTLAWMSLDICVRLFGDALNILTYLKLCGFEGIGLWSITGNILFFSWCILEVLLLVGYHSATKSGLGRDRATYFSFLDGYMSHIDSELFAIFPLLGEMIL